MPDQRTPSSALEGQIASQPAELARLLDEPLPHDVVEGLRQAHRIWLVGTGTSQHAAELGAMLFHDAGRGAHAMSSMHFVNWAPPIDLKDALILISHNAGTETAYAGAAWTIAVDAGLGVVPITRRGGTMPRAIQTVDKETSHTYTVSYTAVLLLLARLALELGAESFDGDALSTIPQAVGAALASPGTESIPAPERLLVLTGEGPAAVTAREGALKLREAARVAAEGYDVEPLLHGHAVPLDARDRMVALTPPDTDGLVDGVAAAAERAGVAVTRLHEPSGLPPILAQTPLVTRLQLLASRLSAERGTNPDVAIEGPWADEALWAIGSPDARR
ncbi:MAG TPA: SIS domain-containing protein [Actinomycetota bacterium]|nr:SIS domain-containing protein [Actinomycetota bacterium]